MLLLDRDIVYDTNLGLPEVRSARKNQNNFRPKTTSSSTRQPQDNEILFQIANPNPFQLEIHFPSFEGSFAYLVFKLNKMEFVLRALGRVDVFRDSFMVL